MACFRPAASGGTIVARPIDGLLDAPEGRFEREWRPIRKQEKRSIASQRAPVDDQKADRATEAASL